MNEFSLTAWASKRSHSLSSVQACPPPLTICISAANRSIGSTTGCIITEKAPTRAFSWLKAPTSAFTFKTLLRHYAKRALTPQSLNMTLGPQRNYHKGRAAIRHCANQTACPLWPLHRLPIFTHTFHGFTPIQPSVFQPGEGPSRGSLRDCEIFAKLRLNFFV